MRAPLGTKIEATGEKGHQGMFWMQEISGSSTEKPTSWEFTKKQDRGRISVPSGRRRFRRTTKVSEGEEE